jgi:hypothetical protein
MEAVNTIICPQCAGENQIPVDEKFLECQFCGSAIYIDKKKVVNHFVISSNFNQQTADGNLRRWMAGNFQAKNLDKLAKITQVSFYYFPMWYFKTDSSSGDKIYLQPASSTAISEIKKINIPAGSLKVFNKKDFDVSQFVNPDVLYESAQSWLSQTGVDINIVAESNLVHIPFFQFNYEFGGKNYTALVEASSGMVYANVWPAKSEMPYRMLFVLSLLAFGGISLISLVLAGMFSKGSGDFFIGVEVLKIIGYGLAAIPLIIIAYIIAKKV